MLQTAKLDDEVGRLAALERYDILDTGNESEFEQIVALVQRVFAMPMAAVTLIDADRQWFKARRGIGVPQTSRRDSFCQYTIAADDGLAVEDASADPRFADTPLVVGDPNIRSYLGAPLRTPDGYQIGALCIISDEVRRFSADDRAILRAFSEVVMSHIEMRQIASEDALTGSLTRRSFDQVAYETLQAQRNNGDGARSSAIAIIDIDHFKRINDCHGHACGDAVLKVVTAAVRSVLAPADLLGRLGGEEFGVLIDCSDRGDAAARGEAMRAAVAGAALPGLPGILVTVSIGVAMCDAAMTTAEAWMAAADAALYG
ncbi:MAG: sensor domain-containing diguanylate cyclase, partial [Sandarakinorhabdus sp.]|nr:sensor domain-containing diguanylate cyclase [Sandarakinorhabdus sp.]